MKYKAEKKMNGDWEKANVLFTQGLYLNAITECRHIKDWTRNQDIRFFVALCYKMAGIQSNDNKMHVKAINQFLHIKGCSKNPLIQFNLGQCYEMHGKLDKAIVVYQKANQLKPKSPIYAYHFCRLIIEKQEPHALEWLTYFLTQFPQNPEFHLLYADYFQKMSADITIINQIFNHIIEQFPHYSPAYFSAIQHHAAMHDNKVYFLYHAWLHNCLSDEHQTLQIQLIINAMEHHKHSSAFKQTVFKHPEPIQENNKVISDAQKGPDIEHVLSTDSTQDKFFKHKPNSFLGRIGNPRGNTNMEYHKLREQYRHLEALALENATAPEQYEFPYRAYI